MKHFLITLFFSCLLIAVKSQVRLPALVKDSMILQRGADIRIWGWAAVNEKISISFQNKKHKTIADANGNWIIHLPPTNAGGPYTMRIDASNHIAISNILFGDVWFCSGQSNMVHQLRLHSERYADEIRSANYSEIRQFLVSNQTSLQHAQNNLPTGYWKSANSKDVLEFSAVAYFFAKKIYEKYRVPIGLINASVGGTPIEAWTSEEGLRDFSDLSAFVEKNKDTAYINDISRKAIAANAIRSLKKETDKGLTQNIKWFDTAYEPKAWRNINIPGFWEDQGIKDLNGIVWYRREIDIPGSMTGIPAKIALGRIVDADFLYVNGKLVGNTTYQYPQRRYHLPAGVLKPGKNIFVIRVVNNSGKGGFVYDKPYYIKSGADSIDLKGDWQYKVGEVYMPQLAVESNSMSFQNQPAALYNAMVAPLINYSIKGMLWYQGESNTSNAAQYKDLLPALIKDWRHKWQLGDLPFLYVQLPGYMDVNYLPSESEWAALREAQLKALSVQNTAMAVAIDLGEWNDIHPDRKKELGERLALAAQKLAYGSNVIYSGPLFKFSAKEAERITITFDHVGTGLIASDGEALSEFAIAGADKKFVWANAKIEGDKVIVWNDTVKDPMYVRYAWADNPVNPNLYNREGLPASPFRTDN